LVLSCATAIEVTNRQVAKNNPTLFAALPERSTDFALRSLFCISSTFPPDSGFAKVELPNKQPS
jgi:hypothetical protein